MNNPILTALQKNNPIIPGLNRGNANAIFNQLMQRNPQFKQFIESNQGKSPEQIAQEHGINFNDVLALIK